MLRHLQLSDPSEVQQKHIAQWRLYAVSEGFSPVSVEAAIKAVSILTGRKFQGEKLKRPQKRPLTVRLEDLSAVYAAAKKRQCGLVCRFLRFAYITGLRLSDLLDLHRSQITDDAIEVSASKTGKLHLIPRHPILCHRLPDAEYPLKKSPSRLRKKIRHYCEIAGVPYFTPQMIRRTSANEYEKAHPGAGGVLLGHSLGSVTYSYYLDQLEVLRKAQESLAIPDAMLPTSARKREKIQERQLNQSFRRLCERDRETVLKMVSRLA